MDRALVLAAVLEKQEIEAALGEEEPMRAAHHFLAAEVPHIEPHLALIRRPCLDLYSFALPDAGRALFVGIASLSVDQEIEQRGLAHRLIADDEKLDLIERPRGSLRLRLFEAPIGGENGLGVDRFERFLRQQAAEVAIVV